MKRERGRAVIGRERAVQKCKGRAKEWREGATGRGVTRRGRIMVKGRKWRGERKRRIPKR